MKVEKIRDKYLEERLHDWAAWYIKDSTLRRLGYGNSNCSNIQKLGLVLIQQTAVDDTPDNPAAEEMEVLIKDLALYKPKWAQALKDKYLALAYGAVDCGFLMERLARKRSISKRRFEERIFHAKNVLQGNLREKFKNIAVNEQKENDYDIATPREIAIMQS